MGRRRRRTDRRLGRAPEVTERTGAAQPRARGDGTDRGRLGPAPKGDGTDRGRLDAAGRLGPAPKGDGTERGVPGGSAPWAGIRTGPNRPGSSEALPARGGVPGAGLEPASPFGQMLLRHPCMPIPPSRLGAHPESSQVRCGLRIATTRVRPTPWSARVRCTTPPRPHRRGRGADPPRPEGDARGGGLRRGRRGRATARRPSRWPTRCARTWSSSTSRCRRWTGSRRPSGSPASGSPRW